jgi:esterase/lipase
MQRVALILHGWPQTSMNEHVLVIYLKDKGFQVITPNLFDTGKEWTQTKVYLKIKKDIGSLIPEVIVGISMGGLLLPKLTKNYKDAKLVFIASAPRFKPNFRLMKLMSYLLERHIVKKTISFLYEKLSDLQLANIYRKVNPFTGNASNKKLYEEDLRLNITAIKKYPFSKHLEILKTMSKVDNTELLSDIKNSSIIFGGSGDSLMPLSEVRKLKSLIKGSKLLVTHGSHFNVFSKRNFKQLEKFLES